MLKGRTHNYSSFYRFSVADVVFVVVVLAVSSGALLWMGTRDARGSSGPAVASIYCGDALLETVVLAKDCDLRLRDIGMEFQVRDGRIRVVDADCPHGICVNMGWVGRSGQLIACVPNRVIVKIEAQEEPFLDAIAH
jgi:hypothetical protein